MRLDAGHEVALAHSTAFSWEVDQVAIAGWGLTAVHQSAIFRAFRTAASRRRIRFFGERAGRWIAYHALTLVPAIRGTAVSVSGDQLAVAGDVRADLWAAALCGAAFPLRGELHLVVEAADSWAKDCRAVPLGRLLAIRGTAVSVSGDQLAVAGDVRADLWAAALCGAAFPLRGELHLVVEAADSWAEDCRAVPLGRRRCGLGEDTSGTALPIRRDTDVFVNTKDRIAQFRNTIVNWREKRIAIVAISLSIACPYLQKNS